jgi:NAD(P)-dependent dehydrogenase (short-subunit alcohol dehydrogenase family)
LTEIKVKAGKYMFLEKNNYNKKALLDKTVLVTGGGGGIGFEASRAFSYMGAKVIIAEIDAQKGSHAQKLINDEFRNDNVDFYEIDISDEKQIDNLYKHITTQYTQLDVIINNAAVVPMGAIDKVPISDWDLSYAVNLRAPIILTQKFLPSMRKTDGVIVFVPSAATTPYMSAYEIFKTAQVELCNTLSEEIADTSIITYAIAPGFVKTETAVKAVEIVASSMGIMADDFYKLHNEYILDVELAGTGYAVSVVNAKQYQGKEIMSHQVLQDSGLISGNTEKSNDALSQADLDKLSLLFTKITDVFFEQYHGWQKKNLFQKQFILTDFKKQMGLPVESFKNQLETLQSQIQNHHWDSFISSKGIFIKLQHFYEHQKELLKNYEKDVTQLNNDTNLLNNWIEILQNIIDII